MFRKFCPKCKKLLKRNRKFSPYYKCKCGYKLRKGPSSLPPKEKKVETTEKGIPKLKKEDVPELIEKKRMIPSKMTAREKDELRLRNEALRNQRKKRAIEKFLKRLRKSKYSGLKGKKILIEGKLYEV